MNKVLLKSDFDFDFILLAISCSLKDYRLCHFINKYSGLSLQKSKDHEAFIPLYNTICRFSNYTCVSEEVETEYYFLSNRAEDDGLLIPEMKNTDYFLIIKNFIDEEDLTHLLDSINAIPEVVVATEIDPVRLKSRENLIFWGLSVAKCIKYTILAVE